MSRLSGLLWQLLQKLSGSVMCEGVLLLESESGNLRSDASASSDVFVLQLLLGLGGWLSLRSLPLLTSSFSESYSSSIGMLEECSKTRVSALNWAEFMTFSDWFLYRVGG